MTVRYTTIKKTFGFTIMEVMVAVVIFSIVLTAVLRLMSMGDLINGRRLWLSHAVMCASSQAERIRQQESSLEIMGDTSYEESIDGQGFHVDRVRLNGAADKFSDTASYLEFMITVKRANDTGALARFRLLQGKNADNIITKK
jgi:prepilin-type N-terminal cleavage/methylation domain-containing protein